MKLRSRLRVSHKHYRQVPNWGIPLIYSVAAVVAGLTVPRLEDALLPEYVASVSAGSATAIYSAIASGMIALTGIVFSLAFVMVQFSATAYSPRLVLWIARDPVMSHAMGMFTATFLYALAALAWVDRRGSGRVGFFGMWFVMVLLLASMAMFVALIQRIGVLQINRILQFIGDPGRKIIESMYPPLETPRESGGPEQPAAGAVTQTVTYTGRPQALQSVDVDALLALAEQCNGFVEVDCCVGDTMIDGSTILRVYGGRKNIAEQTWRDAFQFGDERNYEQDPKYAIRLLVDVAIKALSPAVNDPTTAVQALDQIEDLLRRLGRKRLEIGEFRDESGTLRVVVPFPTWEDFLALAFDEIRFCGGTSVQVMRRLKALLGDLISTSPQERLEALRRQQKLLDSTVTRSFTDAEDKMSASVEDRQGLGIPRKPRAST